MRTDQGVRCQHCPAIIHQVTVRKLDPDAPPVVLWEDEHGFTVCLKATGPLPITFGEFLSHQPMPVIT